MAQEIYIFLTTNLQLTVHDWAMDFHSGGTILEEIERAERLCTCGLFLFTADDPMEGPNLERAAPRDNVIFETGYSLNAKGKERTLIIRETWAATFICDLETIETSRCCTSGCGTSAEIACNASQREEPMQCQPGTFVTNR